MENTMPTLKVKPLEWYMQADAEQLRRQGYVPMPTDWQPVGQDGYYCWGYRVWFEVAGVGYAAYPRLTGRRARELFCYSLRVNDEAILCAREVAAMRAVLSITRDADVKRTLNARLALHAAALGVRASVLQARLAQGRLLGRRKV